VDAEPIVTKRVLGIAGFKNSGKTTLLVRLVEELTRRGYRLATVKHAHHSFDIDHAGRDSYRHREAGAREVAVVSRYRWALMHELGGLEADEPSLQEIVDKLGPCDLVLVEGFKRDRNHFKIEVRDVSQDAPLLAAEDATVIAVAANGAVNGLKVPVFDRDDGRGLADFVVAWAGLQR
jgi:molybdopterin-guanine dinucleotide biosynthesis protein B